jgi:hypothetical protein
VWSAGGLLQLAWRTCAALWRCVCVRRCQVAPRLPGQDAAVCQWWGAGRCASGASAVPLTTRAISPGPSALHGSCLRATQATPALHTGPHVLLVPSCTADARVRQCVCSQLPLPACHVCRSIAQDPASQQMHEAFSRAAAAFQGGQADAGTVMPE